MILRHAVCLVLSLLFALALAAGVTADEPSFRDLQPDVFPAADREQLATMVRVQQRQRLFVANDASTAAWRKINGRADWEAFRKPRVAALQASLGQFPEPPRKLPVRVTGKIVGDGYRIENLVFESRPGLWVTANLYQPAEPRPSMPGLLIFHSHHQPKEDTELQDMGMTWARAGCLVLVMDQLGHGERRQHPFRSPDDFARMFRVSRQDYIG